MDTPKRIRHPYISYGLKVIANFFIKKNLPLLRSKRERVQKREECDSYYKYVDNSLLYKLNDGDWEIRDADINYFLTLKFAEYNEEV